MKFNKNKNRNSRHLKVKDIRIKEKGVGQCIAYTLTKIAIALSKVKISKLSKLKTIKYYTCNKYKITQNRSIKQVIDLFFRISNFSLRST